MPADRSYDVSVIIINYNVKYFAEQCIRSVYAATEGLRAELFVVDNNSSDGSIEHLTPLFPEVQFIENDNNLGFGRANNIALERSTGRYLLILNPDTLIREDSLRMMIRYMDEHPEVGAMGPKILTRDGSFDKTSKRGLPTPWVAFCRISGLSVLFPHSKLFGRYDLLYLDSDKPAQVDSLAGSCMMVRSETYDQVGGFDEDFFMYGEDIDWSYRIKLAGWEVHYAPVTEIVHFRGESTRRSTNFDRDKAFYGAMHLFVDKHFRSRYPFLGHKLIDLGIVLASMFARLRQLYRRIGWSFIDWILLWSALAAARMIKWGIDSEWSLRVFFVLSLYATVWMVCVAAFGGYGKRRGQIVPLIWGMGLGFLINSSFTFFFNQFAYSRLVMLLGGGIGGLFIWGWRVILMQLKRSAPWRWFYQRRTLIVGVGEVGLKVLKRLRKDQNAPYFPVGFVDPDELTVGSFVANLPVLGGENELGRLTSQEEIEEIFFAYDKVDYDRVLKVVGLIGKQRRINFKVITPDTAELESGLMPLLSVEYLSPRRFGQSLRKIAALVVKQ